MCALCLLASFHIECLFAGWLSPLAFKDRQLMVICRLDVDVWWHSGRGSLQFRASFLGLVVGNLLPVDLKILMWGLSGWLRCNMLVVQMSEIFMVYKALLCESNKD